MNDAMTTVDHALFSSITQSRIVHLPYDSQVIDELRCQCDDYVDVGDAIEFWGVNDDGADWRVHVALEQS